MKTSIAGDKQEEPHNNFDAESQLFRTVDVQSRNAQPVDTPIHSSIHNKMVNLSKLNQTGTISQYLQGMNRDHLVDGKYTFSKSF